MALISSDIVLNGKHASIARALIENSVYQSGADLFVEAALTGIYFGKKSEIDLEINDRLEVSRTYFQRRSQLENILFIFLQHEKVYQGRALTAAQVFNIDDSTVETKTLLEEIKAHALYGIEKIGKNYSTLLEKTSKELVIDVLLDENLTAPKLLSEKVEEDKKIFLKQETDEEIDDILNI